MSKNIALTGGGTAGHVTPNLALYPELMERGFNIIYIGSKNGMEKDIVERNISCPFFGITADKLRRYHDSKNLLMPFHVIKGISEAKKILKNNNIDIVFSKGGYVSLPVVIAAHELKIPVISHEADFTPGLANKIAIPFSKKICCNFSETVEMIKKNKGVHTGCPVRDRLLHGSKENGLKYLNFKNKLPILFVIGGSLGSIYLNDLIRKNIDKLQKYFNIVHSTGKGKLDFEFLRTKANGDITSTREGYRQYEMITDVLPDVFAASDLIISRAGANVIFEILALKKLNLLIPLSTKASRGDQILNAKSFVKHQFSEMLLEEDADKDPDLLFKKIMKIHENKNIYLNSMNEYYKEAPAKKICDIIEENLL